MVNDLWEQANSVFHCDCKDKRIKYRLNTAGAKMYFFQCIKCGSTGRIAKTKVANPDSPNIQPVDEELSHNWWERKHNYYQLLIQKQKEQDRQRWFDWYNQYLKSPQWAKKRAAVLKRANHICEGCLEKPAVQVHHLTYKRVGNEMLFDLVAVCNDCHKIIHDSEDEQAMSA